MTSGGRRSPQDGQNLGAQLEALELHCARLTARAQRVECAAAELCRAPDVPPWAKRMMLNAIAEASAQGARRAGPGRHAQRRLASALARRVAELLADDG